jgi:hypothetical protein
MCSRRGPRGMLTMWLLVWCGRQHAEEDHGPEDADPIARVLQDDDDDDDDDDDGNDEDDDSLLTIWCLVWQTTC